MGLVSRVISVNTTSNVFPPAAMVLQGIFSVLIKSMKQPCGSQSRKWHKSSFLFEDVL